MQRPGQRPLKLSGRAGAPRPGWGLTTEAGLSLWPLPPPVKLRPEKKGIDRGAGSNPTPNVQATKFLELSLLPSLGPHLRKQDFLKEEILI